MNRNEIHTLAGEEEKAEEKEKCAIMLEVIYTRRKNGQKDLIQNM